MTLFKAGNGRMAIRHNCGAIMRMTLFRAGDGRMAIRHNCGAIMRMTLFKAGDGRMARENKRGGAIMNLVITMSRRYGTGASMIAGELSDRLGIPVYDKAYIENELHDNSFSNEAEVIRELAKKSCIILGRCASEILKDQENVFNIYVCADKEDRIHRIMKKESLSYEDAKTMLEQNDRERSDYYNKNTGKVWGDVNNYHMILDTSRLGAENCANILIKYFERIEII